MEFQIASLIEGLHSRGNDRQRAAAEELAELGTGAQPAIVALIMALNTDNEEVKVACFTALEEVGPPAELQINSLAAMATAATEDVAYWSVTMLGRAARLAAPALEVLVERLKDGLTPNVQQRAAWALGQLGADVPEAVTALEVARQSSHPTIAAHASRALERIKAA